MVRVRCTPVWLVTPAGNPPSWSIGGGLHQPATCTAASTHRPRQAPQLGDSIQRSASHAPQLRQSFSRTHDGPITWSVPSVRRISGYVYCSASCAPSRFVQRIVGASSCVSWWFVQRPRVPSSPRSYRSD